MLITAQAEDEDEAGTADVGENVGGQTSWKNDGAGGTNAK